MQKTIKDAMYPVDSLSLEFYKETLEKPKLWIDAVAKEDHGHIALVLDLDGAEELLEIVTEFIAAANAVK